MERTIISQANVDKSTNRVRINFDGDDWGEFERVTVYVDNKEVASVCTASDSPEDNNCSRLGIADEFARLAKALGAIVEHTMIHDNDD